MTDQHLPPGARRLARRLSKTTIEVSPDELGEIAANSGAPIDLPADRAGWARVTVEGQTYRAWLLAPGQVTL